MTSMLVPESQTPTSYLGSDVETGRDLRNRIKEIQESIAYRAYELFEERGHQHGNDLEDWLRAESEVLLPIAVKTYEFEDTFITHAQIPVLRADEIQVSVEQRRIVISDNDRPDILDTDDVKSSKRLLCTVVLPDRVDWTSAAMSFRDGVLEIEVPKLSISRSGFGMDASFS
jgi:HSP20 family molecular chaperone IbpA